MNDDKLKAGLRSLVANLDAPPGVMRPMLPGAIAVQRLPSGPATIPHGSPGTLYDFGASAGIVVVVV